MEYQSDLLDPSVTQTKKPSQLHLQIPWEAAMVHASGDQPAMFPDMEGNMVRRLMNSSLVFPIIMIIPKLS